MTTPTPEGHEIAAFFLSTGMNEATRKYVCQLLRNQATTAHNVDTAEALRRVATFFTLNVNAGLQLGAELSKFVAEQTRQHGGVWEARMSNGASTTVKSKKRKIPEADGSKKIASEK